MNLASGLVTFADCRAARQHVAGRIVRTPTVPSPFLSARAGAPVFLKLENRQTTGSFKPRGASNALASMSAREKARGVIAVSTGNHGRALAHVGKLEGLRVVICMSQLVPGNKVDEIRRLGAEVHIVGNSQDEAQEEVDRLVAGEGLTMLPPFDHPAIIAGQGTLGLEMVEETDELETVVVPVSGGGLAAGIAVAVKGMRPKARVVGVSMERGAAMHASLGADRPILVEEAASLADSLGGGIGLDNRFTFAMCRELLDDLVLLTEAEIAAGIVAAYAEEREVVEGAGAVGIGALLAGKIKPGGVTVVLVSGRNIDMEQHRRIVSGEHPAQRKPSECPASRS